MERWGEGTVRRGDDGTEGLWDCEMGRRRGIQTILYEKLKGIYNMLLYNKVRFVRVFYLFFIFFYSFVNIQIIIGQTNTSKQFHINGKLKKVKPSDKIYLYEIDIQGFKPLDSISLRKSGKFSFVVNTDETMFLFLKTSKDDIVKLIASPGDNIFIEGFYDKLPVTYSVKGSDDSELLRKIDKEVIGDNVKVKQMSDFYKQSLNKQDVVKIKDSLDIVFNNILKSLEMFLQNTIIENSKSLACLTAINQGFGKNQIFTFGKDDSLFYELAKALISKYPGNKHARAFYENVDDYMKFKSESDAVESRVGIGVKAPEIVLPDKDSTKVFLSNLKGKTVLIRFWNPSCDVCRAENRKLVPLYQKYKSSGFEVFEVSIGTKKDEWLIVMDEDKTNVWTNVKIPEEGDNIPNMSSYYVWLYGVKSVPYSFLINKEGVIANKGFKTDEMDDMLHNILNIK